MKFQKKNLLSVKPGSSALWVYAGMIFCTVIFGYWIARSFAYPPHDFSNSYFGAYFFLKGEFDPGIFDPYTFNKRIYAEGFHHIFASYNPNPPFTALFFTPFALLPLSPAKLIFNLLSCILFLLSVYRLCKHQGIRNEIIFILLLVIFFVPIRNEILFGQTYFLLFFLLVEGYLAYERKNNLLVSLLWGLAIFIKVFPVMVFLFLILKKEWKIVWMLTTVCIVLLMLSVSLQGIDVWRVYFLEVLPRSNRGEITGAYVSNYQSAWMLFKYAFISDAKLNPDPVINSIFLFNFFQILFKTFILALCSSVILKDRRLLSFGIMLLSGILISPYGNTYSCVLLLVILIAVMPESNPKIFFYIIIVLTFFISNLPVGIFSDLPLLIKFPRLLLFITLFVIAFSLSKVKFQWTLFAVFLAAFTLPVLIRSTRSEDTSILLLNEQKHSLVFDYGITDGFISYRYWSDDGEKTEFTNVPGSTLLTGKTVLRNNQIYYEGKQVTNTPDNKLKPALLDNKTIIYLSDKDRGIGFYNLRTIDPDKIIKNGNR